MSKKIYLVFCESYSYVEDEYIKELKKAFSNKESAEKYILIENIPIEEDKLELREKVMQLNELKYSNATMRQYDKLYEEIQKLQINISAYQYEIEEVELEE